MTSSSWREFLIAQTKTIGDTDASALTSFEQEDTAGKLIALTDYRLLVVSGPDAETFLQGQLTCDVKSLGSTARLGGHCTPKGRLISSFLLVKLADQSFGLRVHASIVEPALTALKKYIVFSKAEIHLSEWVGLAAIGNNSFSHSSISPPSNTMQTASDGGITIRHDPNTIEVWGQSSTIIDLWQNLTTSFSPCPPATWSLRQIQQGIVDICAETSEQFSPQALNFEELDAVSFKKGCFTGQEIIARMHYKGQAKKHCFYATLPLINPIPTIGSNFHLANTHTPVANLVACASDSNAHHCLIVCNNELFWNKAELFYPSNNANKLLWSSLPYAIPK